MHLRTSQIQTEYCFYNLISRTEKVTENRYIECRYAYDGKGRLIRETDGEGNETDYRYEEDSAYPCASSYGDGTVLACTYSRTGRRLTEDDGAVRREYGYNKGGYRTMERDGEGNETRYLYDGMGRKLACYTPIQWQNKDGRRIEYKYDFLERLIDTVHPDGSHERLYRDGEGNIIKEVHPNAYDDKTGDGAGTVRDYDGENRLVSVTEPDGTAGESYAYDLKGRCVCRTDADGFSTYYAYDLLGRLIEELSPAGEDAGRAVYRRTSYEYDNNGSLIRETRHGGEYREDGTVLTQGEDLTLSFAYDAKNRLVSVEDGLGARVSYRYDARGKG